MSICCLVPHTLGGFTRPCTARRHCRLPRRSGFKHQLEAVLLLVLYLSCVEELLLCCWPPLQLLVNSPHLNTQTAHSTNTWGQNGTLAQPAFPIHTNIVPDCLHALNFTARMHLPPVDYMSQCVVSLHFKPSGSPTLTDGCPSKCSGTTLLSLRLVLKPTLPNSTCGKTRVYHQDQMNAATQ